MHEHFDGKLPGMKFVVRYIYSPSCCWSHHHADLEASCLTLYLFMIACCQWVGSRRSGWVPWVDRCFKTVWVVRGESSFDGTRYWVYSRAERIRLPDVRIDRTWTSSSLTLLEALTRLKLRVHKRVQMPLYFSKIWVKIFRYWGRWSARYESRKLWMSDLGL
jgi:hypothetical protein